METERAVQSRIRLTLEGMLVLFAREGRPYADVGLLKYAPNHTAHLLITTIPAIGAPETITHLHNDALQSRMWLDVQKTSPRIELWTDTTTAFNRALGNGHDNDFRWAVDFEGPEVYETRVTRDQSGFRSFLQINDGKFYTQEKSENLLTMKKPGKPLETIGRVAVKLACVIQLSGTEVAYFSNGTSSDSIPLPAKKDVDYGIYFALARHGHESTTDQEIDPETDVDADHYHTAMATDKPPSRRIKFGVVNSATPAEAFATPDAACFPPTAEPPGY